MQEGRKDELRNDSELKFSREQGFFDKSRGIRLLIGIFFTLCLFTYLHFRDVKVEVVELGSYAPKYVVSQVDIDFYDEEATIILRQEAVRDIGKIYLISEKDLRERRNEFEEFLVKDQSWRDAVHQSTFEEMYRGMDSLESTLRQLRFTDPRTLNKMHEMGIDTDNYLVFTPPDPMQPAKLPYQIWMVIEKEAFPKDQFQRGTAQFIIHLFQEKRWLFEDDIPAQRNLRRLVQASVGDKFTHIDAGNRLIDQGERVTPRHIAMTQAVKEQLRKERNLWHPMTLLGSLIMTFVLIGVSVAYLYINFPQVMQSNRRIFLLVTILVISLLVSKAVEFLLLSSFTNLADDVRYPIFVPFAAIMICCLMNANIATYMSGFLVIVMAMTLAFDIQSFLIVNIATAIIAVLSTRTLSKRKDIFIVCGKAWAAAVLVAIAMNLYNNEAWNIAILSDIFTTGAFMLITAVMVLGMMPLFESSFRIMTDVTLMEYMDPNNPLLRRLSMEAPGTYQHSVVVGNLAEAAALSIGANGLFCRVTTLYHDIGKIITPQYFTENQQTGMNIHQLLTPLESAQVILAHVSEGVSLGRKAGLPEQFIDIIKQHHGTSLTYYFYKKQLEKVGGDKSQVDEKEFRYSGPRPRSKESAIIMIADTLEAASRSLETVDEETIRELGTQLIKEKIDDRQFDECLLTFEELAIVKETLITTLCAFAHSRIKYPAREPIG